MSPRIRAEVTFAIIPEWLLLHPEISDKAVRLYGVLWRHADKDYRAHPSRQRLALLLRCSKATVDRAVRELVDAGALSVQQRKSTRIGYQSNDYTLHVQPFEQLTLGPSVRLGVVTGEATPSPTSDDTPRPTDDDQNESSSLERKKDASARFDTSFWRAYPARHGRKIGKAKALERWVKLSEEDQALAVRGAKALAAAVARGETFPPDAHRWLRDRLFEDWSQQPVGVSGMAATEGVARCPHRYPIVVDEDGPSSGCPDCGHDDLEAAVS